MPTFPTPPVAVFPQPPNFSTNPSTVDVPKRQSRHEKNRLSLSFLKRGTSEISSVDQKQSNGVTPSITPTTTPALQSPVESSREDSRSRSKSAHRRSFLGGGGSIVEEDGALRQQPPVSRGKTERPSSSSSGQRPPTNGNQLGPSKVGSVRKRLSMLKFGGKKNAKVKGVEAVAEE